MNVRGRAIAAFLGAFLAAAAVGPAQAVEVGEPAPEFSMKSTAGAISRSRIFTARSGTARVLRRRLLAGVRSEPVGAKSRLQALRALGVQNSPPAPT